MKLGSVVGAAMIAALVALGPVQALAAEFGAGGPITTIDDGNVKAAGNSGRFVVKDRNVGGTLSGFIGDTLLGNAPFTFTFGTNVPIMTQSGNIHGTLTLGDYAANVAAKAQLGVTPAPCPAALAEMFGCIETSPGLFFFPGLLINGTLTFTDGAQGHGVVDAWVIPVIDPAGHIVGVFAGALTIQGN